MRAMFFNPKLGRWRQCALALFGLVLALSLHALGFSSAFPAEVRTKQAVVLHLDGAIGPATADYVTDGLKTSAERGAALVILRIDTPGGLDTSMREIIRAILASPIPVATYVSPSGARAASAGTFLLYASHIAAMAPGTNTGAATPVQIAGPLPDGGDETKKAADPMEAKATNDAVAFIRSLAELRGRNADWAEKAVREAASLSAPAALKAGVIDIEARDIPDLLRQMHGRTVTVGGTKVTIDSASLTFTNSPPNWRTRMLMAITEPNVAFLLLMIGFYGLIFEFMNPGSFLPGTLGAICLLIGLYALAALPVNYAGLALILLGIGLLIAEAFLFSHGVLATGGVIAFAVGASILIDADTPEFRISPSLIAGFAVASGAFVLLILRVAIDARRRKVASGREAMIGISGTVLDWGESKGHVSVHGERWMASGHGEFQTGQVVRVTGLSGLTVQVELAREG